MTLAEAQEERRRLIVKVQELVQAVDAESTVLDALEYLADPDATDGRELVSSVSAGLVSHYALNKKRWRPALDAWAGVLRFTHDVRKEQADAG